MRNIDKLLLIFALTLAPFLLSGQSLTKKGGVCFRVDDNPSLSRLHQYDSLFGKYNARFCMALTPWTFPLNPVYVDTLKHMIARGHEAMDNTPTHQTQFFNVLNIQDTNLYHNHGGVDHINQEKVCLRVTNFDTTQSHGEGLVNITGNMVISQNPGEFADLAGDPYFFALWISSPVNKLCLWYDRRAVNPADPDTVFLQSFWNENVSFGTHTSVVYHKMTQRNVIMSQLAIRLLGQRTLKIFSDLGIPRPTTWIHPSGPMPWINGFEIKANMGDSLGYTQGSNFIYYSYLTYNENNPNGFAQFGMQSLDFSMETQSFEYNKHLIANAYAKHYVKIDISRLTDPAGGWNSFISRSDSMLSWCAANNIPVRTYDQWRALLYDSIPSRVANIFPYLQVDLDQDSYPDGFEQAGINGFYDMTDGVPASDNRSFAIYGSGTMCYINQLGGLEAGANKFSVFTKGTNAPGSTVAVTIYFPEVGVVRNFEVPSDTMIWTPHFSIVDVPEGVSVANILITHNYFNTDTVKISGMELRSAGFLKETKAAPQVHSANEPFTPVDLNLLVIDSLYNPQTISWSLNGGTSLDYSIDPGNTLKIQKPISFWVGMDSLFVVATAPDGLRDSCLMAFYSTTIPAGCTGVPIQLTLLDTLDNDIVIWNSEPYDSSINNPNIYNPIVAPKVTTTYYITAINPLGPIHRDTITLYRFPFPVPVVTNDTSACYGYPVQLTVSGGVSYLWSTGQTNDTIVVNPPVSTRYYVRVFSSDGCFVDDSVMLTRVDQPVIEIWGLWPSYCANDPASTVFGRPIGGTYSGSPGLIGDTFYPDLAPSGVNTIYYSYTDPSGCGNIDSIKVTVVPLPVINPLPDTTICADKFIILRAGPGYDNYLWSNGKTDSVIVIDSIGYGLGNHPVWVYVTKDGCAEKDTAMINFIICPIGIGEDNQRMFKIYPNPANGKIFIDERVVGEGERRLEVVDMNGIVVMKRPLGQGTTRIGIDALKPGTYLLRIWQGDRNENYRLIKL